MEASPEARRMRGSGTLILPRSAGRCGIGFALLHSCFLLPQAYPGATLTERALRAPRPSDASHTTVAWH